MKPFGRGVQPGVGGGVIQANTSIRFDFREFGGEVWVHDGRLVDLKTAVAPIRQRQGENQYGCLSRNHVSGRVGQQAVQRRPIQRDGAVRRRHDQALPGGAHDGFVHILPQPIGRLRPGGCGRRPLPSTLRQQQANQKRQANQTQQQQKVRSPTGLFYIVHGRSPTKIGRGLTRINAD